MPTGVYKRGQSKVSFICINCGKIKYAKPSTAKKRKYCSRKCCDEAGRSEESKEKNRHAHLGKKYPNRKKPKMFTKEHIKNISLGNIGKNKGRVMSNDQKKELRQIALEQWKNPKLRELQKQRMIGNNCALGYKHTIEDNQRNAQKAKGKKYALGCKHSDEANQKKREWHIANPNKKFKNTSIEQKIAAELIIRKINFQQNIGILNIANVDFYLPEYNIIIQCDGCYWHNCPIHFPIGNPKRINIDRKQNIDLCKAGFKLYRFWEHSINESSEKCINQINL